MEMDPGRGNELEELNALLDFEDLDQAYEQASIHEVLTPDESKITSVNNYNNLKTLHDFDIFEKEQEDCSPAKKILPSLSQAFKKSNNENKLEKSEVHQGETDSSDDEDNRNAAEQNYTETGRAIKNLIKKQTVPTDEYSISSSWKSNKPVFAPSETSLTLPRARQSIDVYTDPFFGIRIINPLISSQIMREKMQGKTPITFSRLQNHLSNLDKAKDWVFCGVIVSKYIRTSQKGNNYVCWTLSDLKESKTVSVFLFGKAYKELWKTNTHVVVAILNPTPLEKRASSNDVAALSVSNCDQVMIWGQSKDLGTCKSRKKNGEPCTAFVNTNQCDYCVYHVKQEYSKFTTRPSLQSPSGGNLLELRKKFLGKKQDSSPSFKQYTASVVAKPTMKQVAKDQKLLSQLFNQCSSSGFGAQAGTKQLTKPAQQSERVRLMKDAERLQKLTGCPATMTALANEENSISQDQNCKTINKGMLKKGTSKNFECKRQPHTFDIVPPEEIKIASSKSCSVAKTRLEEPKNDKCPTSQNPHITFKSKGKNLLKKDKPDTRGCKKELNGSNRHDVNTAVKKTSNKSKTKQPTKNRFENLTKLTGIHSKPQTSKASHMLQSPADFDVSFEFEDENKPSSIIPQLEKSSVSSKAMQKTHLGQTSRSYHISTNIPGSCTKGLDFSKYKQDGKTPTMDISLSIPLSERKPTTHQGSSLDSHNVKSPNLNPMNFEQTKAEIMSEGCSVTRLKNLANINSPRLGELGQLSVYKRHCSAAKEKALKYVLAKGPIQKESERKDMKRKRTLSNEEEESPIKGKSLLSARFINLINATSKHEDLILNAENEALDEYYNKMEKKEKMEEKMLNTYKMECKAVRCLKCQYKWFSASERCKLEKHPIKVISAIKRFFQCQNCKNRTATLEIIPLHNCSNCGLGNWIRAPMMRERKSSNVHLSIRGGERKFTNSVETDTNLDLLVPDDV